MLGGNQIRFHRFSRSNIVFRQNLFGHRDRQNFAGISTPLDYVKLVKYRYLLHIFCCRMWACCKIRGSYFFTETYSGDD